jgi:translation elongation factor EF-4
MAYRLNELHGYAKEYVVTDVGIMFPEEQSTKTLFTGITFFFFFFFFFSFCANCLLIRLGQVGYVTCGMKSISEALIGDTLFYSASRKDVVPFPGFKVR